MQLSIQASVPWTSWVRPSWMNESSTNEVSRIHPYR